MIWRLIKYELLYLDTRIRTHYLFIGIMLFILAAYVINNVISGYTPLTAKELVTIILFTSPVFLIVFLFKYIQMLMTESTESRNRRLTILPMPQRNIPLSRIVNILFMLIILANLQFLCLGCIALNYSSYYRVMDHTSYFTASMWISGSVFISYLVRMHSEKYSKIVMFMIIGLFIVINTCAASILQSISLNHLFSNSAKMLDIYNNVMFHFPGSIIAAALFSLIYYISFMQRRSYLK